MILRIFLILPRVKAGAEHVPVLLLLLALLLLYVLRYKLQVLAASCVVYIRLTALHATRYTLYALRSTFYAPCTCAPVHYCTDEWASGLVLVTSHKVRRVHGDGSQPSSATP